MRISHKILIFFCIFLSVHATAQNIGIIQDKDGYTNIRSTAFSKSKIIGKITEGQQFIFYASDSSNWWKIKLIDKKGSSIEGFVHKSRIQPLYQTKKIKEVRYHQYGATASSFRLMKRNIDSNDLPDSYLIETIDIRGRVCDLIFFWEGEIVSNHLCYLPPWIKYEYPNDTTIIHRKFDSNGQPFLSLECEVWHQTTYHLNSDQTKIIKVNREVKIDTAQYLNEYGWDKDLLFNVLREMNQTEPGLGSIEDYKKSTAKLNGKFPIGKDFKLQKYGDPDLEYEEIKALLFK